MGRIYESSEDLDKALTSYKRATDLDNTSAVLHLELAIIYIKNHSLDNAIKELNLAIKYDPGNLEPYGLLTLIYTLEKKYDLAAKEYEKFLKLATQLDPKNPQLYNELGQIYFQQNKLEAAEKTFKLILDFSPEDLKAHYFLGAVYERQGKIKEAIEEFKQAAKLDPDSHMALNALGYLYAQEGINLDEAEALILKALEYEPDNGAYIDSLGWVYYKKNMLDKAIKQLERAIGLLKDAEIYDHLGDAYFKKGDFKNAEENWLKSLELDPDQANVKEKIENLKDKKEANG